MYRHAIIGGTFDHLHTGHKTLIDTAVSCAEKVTLCITVPDLSLHKQFSPSIEDFETRKKAVQKYLHEKHYTHVFLTTTDNIYGTTLTDETLDVIVVTDETEKNAEHINEKRKEKGWQKLIIITIPFVVADDGKPIRSERIRAGEINRDGHSFEKFFLRKTRYVLPHSLREKLQVPIGDVITEINIQDFMAHAAEVVTVGDIVSVTVKGVNLQQAIAIIDHKSRREAVDEKSITRHLPVSHFRIDNPAGTINAAIAEYYKKAQQQYLSTQETQVILVDGEEDLLGLAIMLLAPLGSVVIYGLHTHGIIAVTVTEAIKAFAKDLLSQFD